MTQVDSTPSLMQGMIVKAHSGFFTVHVDMSGQTYICKAAGIRLCSIPTVWW